ncbi:MAG: hypothetical protein GX955_02130 [Treponema sp.]|jgi:hypothetical protein|nr:hypothetical protein [Treponema sp.]
MGIIYFDIAASPIGLSGSTVTKEAFFPKVDSDTATFAYPPHRTSLPATDFEKTAHVPAISDAA